MANPDNFTKTYCYWQVSFGLICVLLSSPVLANEVNHKKEVLAEDVLPALLPLEFARSFNVVAAGAKSDGPSWEQYPSMQELINENGNVVGSKAAAALLSAGTTAATSAAGDQAECRRPMVEIIALIMDNIDDEDPGHLYGEVEVTDVVGKQSIYLRDDDHWEYMYPSNPASLTGPSKPISAKGTVTVHVNLWDADFTSANDHIIEQVFNIWGDGVTDKPKYGEIHSRKVVGDRGAATLKYMVLCEAVAAKIDATLVRGNDGVEDEVFGQIGARIAGTGAETLVFNIDRDNYTSLRYNVPIPLSRTLVAVPSSSYLHFTAKLYDRDFTSKDDEIIAGCAYFAAKASGAERKRIYAETGEIAVRVTWITG